MLSETKFELNLVVRSYLMNVKENWNITIAQKGFNRKKMF
jgi:hypothetical protein